MAQKNEQALKEAIQKIGYYRGVVTQHSFMEKLLDIASMDDAGAGNPTSTISEYKELIGPENNISEASSEFLNGLLGLTDGGTTLAEFIRLAEAAQSGADDSGDPVLANFDSAENRPVSTFFEGTGTMKFDQKLSIKTIMGKASAGINESPTAPDKDNPNVGVIQFHDAALNFANRDTGVGSIFMNSIPTIEMSKCQPYVDVRVITAFPPVENFGSQERVGAGISMMRFLKGTAVVDPAGTDYVFATAEAGEIDSEGNFVKNTFNTFTDGDKKDPQPVAATIAGMELFTSPQTLVDAENDFVDLEQPDGTGAGLSDVRSTPTIDKFRPFMTFKNISFSVTPTRGMMSTEAGDISFTLHDRSRLHEIAQFVRPSSVGKEVELFIEWGWSHPEAGQADGRENYFADLLNAMRVKKKYRVVNSTLTFNNVGEVDIKCKIVTAGAKETTRLMVTTGEIEDQLDAMQEIIKAIRIMKRKIRADLGDNEEIAGDEILGKANSASAVMGMKTEDIAEVRKFANALINDKGVGADYKELGSSLNKALGSAESLSTMISGWFSKTKKLCDPTSKNSDPFLKNISIAPIQNIGKETQRGLRHVSFAKLALHFIAKPLAASKRFDEVQLIFYPFNEHASYAADMDIGAFPINFKNFSDIMLKEFEKRPNMTVAAFVGRMNQNFFANMACDGYGFGNIYERDGETGKAKLSKSYSGTAAKAAKARNAKLDVLKKAYDDAADPKFKRPQVQMFIEAVPGNLDSGGSRMTILRLHFFDKACNSYSGYTAMWDSMRSSMLSSINGAAVGLTRAIKKAGDGGSSDQVSNHRAQYEKQFATIAALNLLEIVDEKGVAKDISAMFEPVADAGGNTQSEEETADQKAKMEAIANSQIRIKGGPQGLRHVLSMNMPTIKYGTETSAVIQASLATKTDSKLATIHMTTQKEPGKRNPGAVDDGLPLRTFPAELKLDCFGFPMAQFGQQYFIDFGTGTSLDDVYVVTGIDHTLSPGEFKTSLKMTPMMKFGKFQSLIGNIGKVNAELAGFTNDTS